MSGKPKFSCSPREDREKTAATNQWASSQQSPNLPALILDVWAWETSFLLLINQALSLPLLFLLLVLFSIMFFHSWLFLMIQVSSQLKRYHFREVLPDHQLPLALLSHSPVLFASSNLLMCCLLFILIYFLVFYLSPPLQQQQGFCFDCSLFLSPLPKRMCVI